MVWPQVAPDLRCPISSEKWKGRFAGENAKKPALTRGGLFHHTPERFKL